MTTTDAQIDTLEKELRETQDKLRYVEEQLGMLTDMLAESQFRERLANVEQWQEEWDRATEEFEQVVEFMPAEDWFRDRAKDN